MKLLAIRFNKVNKEFPYEILSSGEIWFPTTGDFEKEMNEEVLPWANHHGFAIEVTGKIYEEDAN